MGGAVGGGGQVEEAKGQAVICGGETVVVKSVQAGRQSMVV